jgi:hypothetical protein
MIYVLPNIPEALSREICADLIKNLPSPAGDTSEQRVLRDERAITVLAHYIPENAAEAELAADIVAAEFHAKDALRDAVIYPDRAAAIRRHGGMPPGAGYPPPDDTVFKELIAGASPAFLAFDSNHAAGHDTKSATLSHTMAL